MGHPLLVAAPKGYVLLQNGKQFFLSFMAVISGGSQASAALPKLFATFS